MAKDMRTQPTSQNFIPRSKSLLSGPLFVELLLFFVDVVCFETQNRFSAILPDQSWMGVG